MYKWWSWQAGRDDLEEEVCGWHLAAYPPSCILIPYNYTTALDICIYILLTSHVYGAAWAIYIYNNYIVCSYTWYTLNNMGLCLRRLNQKCMPAGHTCIHNN